ncbi:MAG: cytochrome c biogenesis protein CcdA [Gemmatimonadales bacterium]|nr:cytochrome c biogenesis protein CcdA [Gemmatimonadales bacterium]
MTDVPNLSILIALLGGILSFLSPCVLPLVPSYLGFITGLGVDEMTSRRKVAMLHAALFVLGFSLVFMLLGAGATALGRTLKFYQDWIARAGGVLIIFFGLYLIGVFKLRALEMERRVHLEDKPVGYLGTVLVGVAFGAGWTPCIGPVLGAILGLAATEADFQRGMILLGAYSAGLAIPFLLAAWMVESFFEWFTRFRRYLPWVQRISGVLLILVGILLVTGEFTRLAGWLQGLTPEWLRGNL